MLRKKIHIILTTLLLPAITGYFFPGHSCEPNTDSQNECITESTCCTTLPGDCCYYSSQQSYIEDEYVKPVSDTDNRLHTLSAPAFVEMNLEVRKNKTGDVGLSANVHIASKKRSNLTILQRFLM